MISSKCASYCIPLLSVKLCIADGEVNFDLLINITCVERPGLRHRLANRSTSGSAAPAVSDAAASAASAAGGGDLSGTPSTSTVGVWIAWRLPTNSGGGSEAGNVDDGGGSTVSLADGRFHATMETQGVEAEAASNTSEDDTEDEGGDQDDDGASSSSSSLSSSAAEQQMTAASRWTTMVHVTTGDNFVLTDSTIGTRMRLELWPNRIYEVAVSRRADTRAIQPLAFSNRLSVG